MAMIWRLPPAMVQKEIANSGAHAGSFVIFQSKSSIIPLKLSQVRTPAANILKQEMLALGGDAVTPMSTILGTEKYVDIILLGTEKQYNLLWQKLAAMPFFGLEKWRGELQGILHSKTGRIQLGNGRVLPDQKTLVMGIVNLTPDSFYAASRMLLPGRGNIAGSDGDAVADYVQGMIEDGADMVDLGAESTRPGATPLVAAEEQKRLLPVLRMLREKFSDLIISVDTYHGETARRAVEAGADIINDVSGRDDPAIRRVVEEYGTPWVITHNGPGGILRVTEELLARAEKLQLPKDKLILDPGIGFGKDGEDNLEILRNLSMLTCYGYPVLLGASRKSVIGRVLNLPPEERLEGTVAISVHAVKQGVNIIRVHDVRENCRAIRMAEALR